MSPSSAVLFDLDWTLVDATPVWRAARLDLAAAVGLDWVDDLAVLGRGEPQHAVVAAFCARAGRAGDDLAGLTARFVGCAVQQLRPALLLPGAADLLRELAAAGVPCALVTQSDRRYADRALAVLAELGLDAFTVVVAGGETAPKPDPAPYLRAAHLLGVPIVNSCVVEDSLTGITAGLRAGARVVVVTSAAVPPGVERVGSLSAVHWR